MNAPHLRHILTEPTTETYTKLLDIRDAADAISAAEPNATPMELAKRLVGKSDITVIRLLATMELASEIEHERRVRARSIEVAAATMPAVRQSAVSSVLLPGQFYCDRCQRNCDTAIQESHYAWHDGNSQSRRIRLEEKRRRQLEKEAIYAQFEADPLNSYLDHFSLFHFTISENGDSFKRWMAERFEQWYAEWLPKFDEFLKIQAAFESDVNGGDNFAAALGAVFEAHDHSVRLELTKELLNTGFAPGDGRMVTWGDATVEDHTQRISLLVKMAAGDMETAAKHREAIEMIDLAGVVCLSDLSPGI